MDHPHEHETSPDTQMSEVEIIHAECNRMIQMQGVTISSLQQRIWHLEMEIVDLISAGSVARQAPAED